MANEYDKRFDELIDRCEILDQGETREQCCSKVGKHCGDVPKSLEGLVVTNRGQPTNGISDEMGFAIVGCGALLGLVILWWLARRLWRRIGDTGKAVMAGIAVWTLLVLSCVILFDLFSFHIVNDEVGLLVLWIVLPPVCASALFLWFRRFVKAKRA